MQKIALLSDVHGNLSALEAVLDDIDRWRTDFAVVNGDTIGRGPKPRECWELLAERLEHGWRMTLGNHEEYALEWLEPRPDLSDLDREFYTSSLWSKQQMRDDQLTRIQRLPLSYSLMLNGKRLRATHASLHGTRDGIVPWSDDAKIVEKMQPAPDVWITSHTHRMFQREVNGTLVVNTGSVGVPLDGDVRAGYVRLTWDGRAFSAELVRLEYDRAETDRQYHDLYLHTNGATAHVLYAEWRDASAHINTFFSKYGDAMRAGEIVPQEAVARYLAKVYG